MGRKIFSLACGVGKVGTRNYFGTKLDQRLKKIVFFKCSLNVCEEKPSEPVNRKNESLV